MDLAACGGATDYGTKGVEAATNTPGSRFVGSTATDAEGNLWLFNGQNSAGRTNDVWRYKLSTKQWTWMAGTNAANGFATYGTQNVADAANKPGARDSSCTVVDNNGKMFSVAGEGYVGSGGTGLLNDIWSFDITTLQWTYVNGEKTVNALNVTGTKGVAAATNHPAGRRNPACWFDSANRLWIFGGNAIEVAGGARKSFSDLWFYDLKTNMWTWVDGPAAGADVGSGSALFEKSFAAWPGGRRDVVWAKGNQGKQFFFSGSGFTFGVTAESKINDLWSLPVP